MKIVFSSTIEQEHEITELVSFFYSSIFPRYFTSDEITYFKEIGVLDSPKNFGTLKEAYQVMTCLQIIMNILGKKERQTVPLEERFEKLFFDNCKLLNEYGAFFPLELDQFIPLENNKQEKAYLTYPETAANQLLV